MELSPLVFFIIIIALFIFRNILDQKKAQKKREELARQKRQLNPRDGGESFQSSNAQHSEFKKKKLPIFTIEEKTSHPEDPFCVKEDKMVSMVKTQPILTMPSEKELESLPISKSSPLKKLFNSKESKRKAMIISEVLKAPYIPR